MIEIGLEWRIEHGVGFQRDERIDIAGGLDASDGIGPPAQLARVLAGLVRRMGV